MVKNLPATQETWVRSLRQEDSLEKGMVSHCSILTWRIPWMEEPGRLQSMGLQRVGYDRATITFFQRKVGRKYSFCRGRGQKSKLSYKQS